MSGPGHITKVRRALPNYTIKGEIGRGGFGVLLGGVHRRLGRAVAIKLIPEAFARDDDVRARFLSEARVVASLSHPHIVPVYDYVEDDGVCLLVMERLTGGTLGERFAARGIEPETACAAAIATCAALQYAHDHGVLHRDIKPDNVLFSSEGVPMVTDFGIAKVLGGSNTLATTDGGIVGTPAFMAPEQADGSPLGPAVDIYATGVMLYSLLSGELPFSTEGGAMALLAQRLTRDPRSLAAVDPTIPAPIAAVTMRAIERLPERRHKSALTFGSALAEAAVVAWGPKWIERADASLTGAGEILAAAGTVAGTGEVDGHRDATIRRARRSVDDEGPRSATSTVPRAHPELVLHLDGISLDELASAQLVPVHDLIAPRRVRRDVLRLSAGLAVLSLLVALVGLPRPSERHTLGRGAVTVAGADAAAGEIISLDLGKPVPIVVHHLPPAGAAADRVQLRFMVAGIVVGSSSTENLQRSASGSQADLSAAGARYLAASRLTAELRFLKGGRAVLVHDFAARSTRFGLLTVPGAVLVVVLLLAIAYGESHVRTLRRSGPSVTILAGIGATGAVVGLAIVLLTWLTGVQPPVLSRTVLCVLLGAAAGIVAARALGGAPRADRQERSVSGRFSAT